MKKIFTIALAVAAFAACNKSEVVDSAPAAAIAFDNAFVDNTTKAAADITKSNLSDFGVYGTVAKGGNNALIFDNTTVSKVGDAYTYSPAQYWVEGAEYTFSAYAPSANAQWAFDEIDAHNGTLSFDNASANGEQDLLFASATRTTGTISAAPEAVSFTFSHLLSKVVFKYTNVFTDKNISLNVYDVKINNAAATGTMPVVNGEGGVWTGNGDYARSFGDATPSADKALANAASTTTEHFYLIPVEREYNITFKVDLYQAGVLLDTYEHTVETTINLEKGKSYSFNANLAPENVNPETQLYALEFKVNAVEEWVNASTELQATTVATTAELVAAVAEGGEIRLTEDVTLAAEGLTVSKNANIDLNGCTLTVLNSNFVNESTLVVSNGTISGSDTQAGRRAIVNKGNLTMNNVVVNQVYQAGGSAINNDGATAVAVLNNVTVAAENMSISNKNGATMTINGGNIVGNGKGASYSICNQHGSTLIINGGYFEGGHGVVSTTESSVTTLNAGTYHCSATYTGNSDWVVYSVADGITYYSAANCTFTHAYSDLRLFISEDAGTTGQIIAQ